MAGDNLYSAANEATFQILAREDGFQPVLSYPKQYLGDQGGLELTRLRGHRVAAV